MKITAKTIKEDLARCKSAYLRNDDLRAMTALATALKAYTQVRLIGPDRMQIDSQMRESIANINKMEYVKRLAPGPMPYLKGEEAKMLKLLIPLVKRIDEEIKLETLDAMRERKLKIDQCVLRGQKFLEQENILEAQRNFREAVELYVDEKGLFPLIASRLIDANLFKQSLEYTRHAIIEEPNNSRAYDFLRTAVSKLNEYEQATKMLTEARKKHENHAQILATSAWLEAKQGRYQEALTFADSALAVDPQHDVAQHVRNIVQQRMN
ncbi:hypothetical protein [Desulfovibrio inopinatus]|uniref:hypothetical protein n=1 Tax=Desulfovibrio inopinatus TaxID=102109 RepID=UPI0003FA39AD|nr:hypothetical protein [Desulfovibrio inopinatus]